MKLAARVPKAWRAGLTVFLLTRGALVGTAWLVRRFHPLALQAGHFLYHGGAASPSWLIDAFQRWDSFWFLNVAREGYRYYGPMEQTTNVLLGVPETNVTVFPLYPMLMYAGRALIGDASLAGFLISQASLLLSLVLIYRLTELDASESTAELSTWLLGVVPWTYAFSAVYSESLFFVSTVAALLFARRGRYLSAGVCGALSVLTRLPGVLVAVPLMLEYFQSIDWQWRKIQLRALWLLLVPLAMVAFFGTLWRLTGEPLAYFVGQRGWHKEFVPPWHHFWLWLSTSSLGPEDYLNMVTAYFFGVVLILSFRRTRLSYWLYAAVSFAVLMSSNNLLGLPRYCAAVFPLYLMLADAGTRHPMFGRVLLVAFAMGAPMVFWVWTTWSYSF